MFGKKKKKKEDKKVDSPKTIENHPDYDPTLPEKKQRHLRS